MPRLEGDPFPGAGALREPRDRRLVEARIEIAGVHADHLLAAVAEAFAGLAVDIDHVELLVQQEKRVHRVVDKGAEARFARAQGLLGMPPIGDIAHEADHALGLALGVEEHATLRPQPVHGAILVDDAVLGRDITRSRAHG